MVPVLTDFCCMWWWSLYICFSLNSYVYVWIIDSTCQSVLWFDSFSMNTVPKKWIPHIVTTLYIHLPHNSDLFSVAQVSPLVRTERLFLNDFPPAWLITSPLQINWACMEDREGRGLVLKNVTHTITPTLVNRFLSWMCMYVCVHL